MGLLNKMTLTLESYQAMNVSQKKKVKRDELQTLLDESLSDDVNVKESFYINDKYIGEHGSADSLENVFSDIDNKFHDILCNKIKTEVNAAIELLLKDQHLSPRNESNLVAIDYDNDPLVLALKDEILYLKDQIVIKDKIVHDMITKPCDESKNNNDIEILNVSDNNNNNIKLHNRFQILNTTNVSNWSDPHDNILNENETNDFASNDGNMSTKNKKYRSTTIIGDSLIKDIKGYKLKKAINNGDKVYVKAFPGASTECMEHFVKPSIKYNPDLFILHTGSNDLRKNKSPREIADGIVNLATKIKTSNNDVIVSGIIERCDDLNSKAKKVNELLINKCSMLDIYFLDNSNISPDIHLNGSGLHLNYNGTVELANNFLDIINL